ncbi:MAG TPA: ABC transporter substrate-binding protein [Candidatus Binatia bacterium]
MSIGAQAIRLILVLLSFPALALAQPVQPVVRVGALHLGTTKTAAVSIEAFQRGMRELGYTEGKNIVIDYRYGEGKEERYTSMAAELVALKPAVIVTWGTDVTAVVKKVTTAIPIVFALADRPDILGLVGSLSRPGANVTGVTTLNFELTTKRLELLKETIPGLARVAILGLQHPLIPITVKEAEGTARSLGVQLQSIELKSPRDIESMFNRSSKEQPGALLFLPSREIVYGPAAVALALKQRLPTIASNTAITETGGLMNYGPRWADLSFRAATYVDKILNGAKPAELPIEQPTKFELVINLKTAKQIGLTIPPNVLARADRVIR